MPKVALIWLGVAVTLTLLLSSKLGLRGLFWLWFHNGLCALGTGHELWRSRHRQAVSQQDPSYSEQGVGL
jgi:hypothetical protein